jgi:membrane-associated HD superfamily phosphohydrolase
LNVIVFRNPLLFDWINVVFMFAILSIILYEILEDSQKMYIIIFSISGVFVLLFATVQTHCESCFIWYQVLLILFYLINFIPITLIDSDIVYHKSSEFIPNWCFKVLYYAFLLLIIESILSLFLLFLKCDLTTIKSIYYFSQIILSITYTLIFVNNLKEMGK